MPRRTDPVPERECEAADCSVRFTPKRDDARFHSVTCRNRAARARKAAASEEKLGRDEGGAEHSLVTAVRRELEQASALDTVAGQLALQFARRIVDPAESGLTNLSKELRSLLAEAKAGTAAADRPAPAPAAEDDQVARARETRERKAREAAAR